VRFQRLEPQTRGVGKAANRGEKRPEQRGQKRQQGSNRVDEAASEHTARSQFIGGHELQDTLRTWQLSRRREYAGHLGRPPPHERPRSARARPTPAPSCAPMSLKPLLVVGGVLAVHLGVRPPACRTAYRLRGGPYRDLAPWEQGENRFDTRNRRSHHQQCTANQPLTKQNPDAARDGSEGGRSASEGASREGEPGPGALPRFHDRIIMYQYRNFSYCRCRRYVVKDGRSGCRRVAIIDRTRSPRQRSPHMADDQHDYKVGPGRPPLHTRFRQPRRPQQKGSCMR
jgi:hypothetical protein